MQAEPPELYRFQLELFKRVGTPFWKEPQRILTRRHDQKELVVMIYGFFERVYFLYRRRWIDDDTWRQWAAFLQLMANHPVFREVHNSSREMWDKPFVDYVNYVLQHNTEEVASE